MIVAFLIRKKLHRNGNCFIVKSQVTVLITFYRFAVFIIQQIRIRNRTLGHDIKEGQVSAEFFVAVIFAGRIRLSLPVLVITVIVGTVILDRDTDHQYQNDGDQSNEPRLHGSSLRQAISSLCTTRFT